MALVWNGVKSLVNLGTWWEGGLARLGFHTKARGDKPYWRGQPFRNPRKHQHRALHRNQVDKLDARGENIFHWNLKSHKG